MRIEEPPAAGRSAPTVSRAVDGFTRSTFMAVTSMPRLASRHIAMLSSGSCATRVISGLPAAESLSVAARQKSGFGPRSMSLTPL